MILSEQLVRHPFSMWSCLSVQDSAQSEITSSSKVICMKLELKLQGAGAAGGTWYHQAVEKHLFEGLMGSRFQRLSSLKRHQLVHTAV